MKKTVIMLMVLLVFGIASAQVNKIDPPTAVTPPGTPPIENATQKLIRQQARQASPTSLVKPQQVTPTVTQPVQRESKGNTMSLYPGNNLAYPVPQGAIQPGTGTTTGPVNGTNNPTPILPASNTTNQGKVP